MTKTDPICEFDRLLSGAVAVDGPRALAAARFLDASQTVGRFVVGRNAQSEALHRHVPLSGLIDDRAPAGSVWNGVPVVRMDQVPQDAWVVNASTSIAPVSVDRALRAELADHRDAWSALFERLEDDASRRVLADAIRFRLTADPMVMESYSVRFRDQYFEDFLGLRREVFVDAGGFDGDTTEEFCRRVPDYRRVHFFEPSPSNMAKARQRLAGFARIDYREVGLSDEAGALQFDPGAGSASAVSASGSQSIHVDRLDDLVNDPVSFIKMDLEGWELHALRGAAEHIREDRPKLALSVYHQASHFREIPALVLGFCPDYRVRLRHYTEGWSETVMFFQI
jgi:FkbM family methyltransferase